MNIMMNPSMVPSNTMNAPRTTSTGYHHVTLFSMLRPRHAKMQAQRHMCIVAAKKKGGKKTKQKSPSPLGAVASPKPYLSTPVIMQNLLMVESYFRKTGRCDDVVSVLPTLLNYNVRAIVWEA